MDFAGLTHTSSGVIPSEKTLSTICNFPTPTDLTGARSWFGLVNQVAWAYAISPVIQPFRDLFKPNQKLNWDSVLDNLFESSKTILINLVKDGVQSYDISWPTCIQLDWSKDAVGYLLLQKHCQCITVSPVCAENGWKLIYAGSRFTNQAEGNYSPTEGEALAVAWSLEHSRLFTLGCPTLVVATDRLVIPLKLRNAVLSNLHSANQCTTGMKFRAHQCVYWPGMDRSTQIHRDNCLDCLRHAPSTAQSPSY